MSNLIKNRGVSFSLAVATAVVAVFCAECKGAVIYAKTWTHLVVPPRALDPCPSKKEVDCSFAAQDADSVIRTGHVIQVID